MTRRIRLGIRTRLLLAVVGALALALIIGVTAFNVILEQRLSASAESLARAQAQAELSSLKVVERQARRSRGPGGTGRGRKHALGVRGRHDRSRSRSFRPVGQRQPRRSPEGLSGRRRVQESVRLYALPVVDDGKRMGTVVAGVSLDPYEETANDCSRRLDRARRRPARRASRSLPTGSSARRSCPCHA